jgi:hypothetical protein
MPNLLAESVGWNRTRAAPAGEPTNRIALRAE